MVSKHTHFGSFDERFCGSTEQCRQIVLDPNEVSCPACQENDTFELSEQAKAFVATI
jgi:hypothetical protein